MAVLTNDATSVESVNRKPMLFLNSNTGTVIMAATYRHS